MKMKVLDFIDFNTVNILLENFNKSTGFVTAILDLDGRILSKSGWRRICTDFHRINPKTNQNCILSDTLLANDKTGDKKYNIYNCHNGLIDLSIPLIIEGEHIANLFTGQFFLEEPKMQFFKEQALKYGFDELSYLEAVREVPVLTEEKVEEIVDYFLVIMKIVVNLTNDKISQTKAKLLLESSLESPKDIIILAIDKDYNYLYFNEVHREVMQFAYGVDIEIGMSLMDSISSKTDKINAKKNYDLALSGQSHETIQEYGDQNVRYYETFYNPIFGELNEIIGATAFSRDITDRIKMEEMLKDSEKKLLQNKELFPKMLDVIPDMISIHDADMNILYSNWNGFADIPKEKRIIPSKCYKTYRGEDEICTDCEAGKVLKSKKPIQVEAQINEGMWLDVRGIPIFDKEGNVESFVEWVRDISNQKQLELDILEEKEKLAATLNSIGDGVIATDALGIITGINPVVSNLTGWLEEEAVSRPLREVFNITSEDESREIQNPVEKVLSTNNVVELDNHTILISKDKKRYYIEDTASPIRNALGENIGVVLIFRDVTEKKTKEKEMDYLIKHDYLTGLHNRRFFQESFYFLLRNKNIPLGIMMMDVNGLKIINDAYGHIVGDKALKMVADVLNQVFSKPDIVARLGGDEFAVLLQGNVSLEKMEKYKEEIYQILLKRPIKNISISLSIGYEIINDSNIKIDDVFQLAENRMYRHKISEGVSVRNSAIKAILSTLTDKFALEKRHSERVSKFAVKIGKALNLNREDLKELEMAGLFHDIGKISIPDHILDKPGKLTPEEYELIKTHTKIGYQILRAADQYSDLAVHALFHHERWDGFGYPKGLKKTEIPLFSRIICVVDAFEAMTSKRPYKNAMTISKAKAELKRCSGSQFDPQIVDAFIKAIER